MIVMHTKMPTKSAHAYPAWSWVGVATSGLSTEVCMNVSAQMFGAKITAAAFVIDIVAGTYGAAVDPSC